MDSELRELGIIEKEVYTYEDYAKLPEGAPYQLIGGKLIMTPAPSTYHQIISARLEIKITGFITENDLGILLHAPVDVHFEETETYQPDIVFISKERLNIIKPEKIEGAPDLVIEILSPATAYYDLRKKFKVYQRQGIKEYWIVDPEEKSVEIYGSKEGKLELVQEVEEKGRGRSKVLEGFEIESKEIF